MLSIQTVRKILSRRPGLAGVAGRPGRRRRRDIAPVVERVEQRTLLATTIGTNFSAANINTLNDGSIPPDTMGAVGSNNQVVEFVNGVFSVYDKSGATLKQVTDTSFWNASGVPTATTNAGLSDPRVIFDATTSRWFVSMIDTKSTNNDYLLAVSNGINATAGFKAYVIPVNSGSSVSSFGDYDTLGVDDHGVYLSTLGFTSNGNTTSFLFVKKSDLLQEATSPSFKVFVTGDPNVVDNYQPVDDQSGVTTTSHNFYSAGDGYTELVTINGTDPATASLSTPAFVNNSLGSSNILPAEQPGGPNTIISGDFRLSGHVIRALGSDWGIQEVEVASHSAIQWFRFNSTTGAVLNSGRISDPSRDYYYGSIAISPNGNVVIGFTGSSALTTTGFSGYASSFYVSGTTDGSALTLGTPALIKAGGGTYNVTYGTGRNRWGDYSNTVVDPSDPTAFWTVQELAPSTDVWSTQITQIDVQPQATTVYTTVADGTYGVGATIPIVVGFGAPVTVSTAGGTPYLALNLNGATVDAPYTSGSGTGSLRFTYTVGAGQTTAGAKLEYKSTAALVLNGGTITSTSNGSAAILALPAPGAAGSLSANDKIVIDAVAPTVVSYSVVFGSESYNLIGSTRLDLPWRVTGIRAVFSKPITAGDAASLTGLTTTGFSGLGTTTLTWTVSPLTLGSFATALLGTGANKLTDAVGNPLAGGAGFADTFKVLYGDVNGDGYVDSSDLAADYAATVAPYSIFDDINGDGAVTIADVRIVRNRIGTKLP